MADNVEILRGVESSLNMQLQIERAAALSKSSQLQEDLKNATNELQGQRDQFISAMWEEQGSAAKNSRMLDDALREAGGKINNLQEENARLLFQLKEFTMRLNATCVIAVGPLFDVC